MIDYISIDDMLQLYNTVKPLIHHSIGSENNVGLGSRLLDYGVPLTILMYGDCTSYNGWIREKMLDYRGVGLEVPFHTSFITLKNVVFNNTVRL